MNQTGCGAVVYGAATATGRTDCGVVNEAFGVRKVALCDTCKAAMLDAEVRAWQAEEQACQRANFARRATAGR